MLTSSSVEGAEEQTIHDFEGFDGYRLALTRFVAKGDGAGRR